MLTVCGLSERSAANTRQPQKTAPVFLRGGRSSGSFSGLILQLLLDPEQRRGLLAAPALPLQEVFSKLGRVHAATT